MRPGGSSDEPRRRGWARWALRPLSYLGKLLVLAIALVLVLVHCLDRPWLKHRIQRFVRASAGADIDYRDAKVALFSGIEIDDAVVRSPAEIRSLLPDLLRIGRLDAHWSLGSLLGHGPIIPRLALSDVTLAVAVDEHGRTSFDGISDAAPPSAPTPEVPLSHQASNYLGAAPLVGRIDVDRATLTLLRTEHGAAGDRFDLRGVSLALVATPAEPNAPGWQLKGGLGSQASPLSLELARTQGDARAAARAAGWLSIDATPAALMAALDLRMVQQSFAASVAADHWLHAEARARFDAAAGHTEITLDHTEAGDGAVVAEASVDLPDAGDPVVRRAHGDVDLARLLRWLPPGLAPMTAAAARLRAQVDCLVAGSAVRMSECGAASVDAELSDVSAGDAARPLRIDTARLSLHAQPANDGGVAARGSVTVGGARLPSLAADGISADFDGQRASSGAISGRLGLRFARLERTEKKSSSLEVFRDGRAEVRAEGLQVDPERPLATRGDLEATLDVGSLDAREGATHAIVDGLGLRAHAALEGHAPYAVELRAPMSRLRVLAGDGRTFVDSPARLDVQARDIDPDAAHPEASRGVIHVAVDAGGAQASLDATKGTDAADFMLHASIPSLEAIRPLLSEPLAGAAPWARMGVSVQSNGRIEHLGGAAPKIRHTTQIDVTHPAFGNTAARSLSLHLESEGTAQQHQGSADLRAEALAIDGGDPSDDHLSLSAGIDRARRTLQFQLASGGRATTKLSGRLAFDPSARALAYDIDGHFERLAALAPLAAKMRGLDAFDLGQLGVDLAAHGALLGVVDGVSPDGAITLAPAPARTAAVEGKLDLHATHFHWAKGDTAVISPEVAWHGEMHVEGERRTLDSHAEVGAIHLDLGSKDVDLHSIHDEARAAFTGDLREPEIELEQRLAIGGIEQDVVPEYPLGDLTFALSAERTRARVVHISQMKLASSSGGTTLAANGNLDMGEDHRTLSLTTSITQELGRLSKIPERFRGKGNVAVEANVTSPDLAHFRVHALVKGKDVTVVLPRKGVEVDTANGEVPVAVTVDVGPHGVGFDRTEKANPYSMLRFADQHPLLDRSGFLSVARVKTPFVSVAPLIGNLAIEQNVISLRQFEIGVRGGTITGQCALDWNGPKSSLELHVRANGVQSSHGEPFDGNIAVVMSAEGRTIDGRAEVLRIGERHLLDLLDLEDPLHVDPGMNRIRFALIFGYPKSMRLVFDHGFASAHLELGGVASLISIGELRGIPMGPIVDKMLTPAPDTPAPQPTP